MTEDQDVKDSQSDSGGKTFVNKNKDKKAKPHRPLTKIILRRLPPTMTEESFLEQVSPIPEHDHFYFAKPDLSLGNNVYSRAYINFLNVDDIYLFRDKFDGYVFIDEKGVEYVGIVEYAPFQRIPKKKKKKDPKCGTIESDPIYQEFLENLDKEQETDNQPKLEYSYPINDSSDKKAQSTPLLEYLAARKLDKRGRDERRRRENDKRKMRIERKGKDMLIKKPGDISEDDNCDDCNYKHSGQNFWYGEQRIYHKSKPKYPNISMKTTGGSDEITSTDSDWDTHYPALTIKTHNTFTLKANDERNKKYTDEVSHKSGGDTHSKEEDRDDSTESDVKKIKPRDGDKEKANDIKDDEAKESKDGIVFESKVYKDQRKIGVSSLTNKPKKIDGEKKENINKEHEHFDDDKSLKKERRDKIKESPREQKSKKYSDTRKERLKQVEQGKSDKQSVINKILSTEGKSKSLNHDDIIPFTQLPQVKTEDLTKMIEDMDRKVKMEEDAKNKDSNQGKLEFNAYDANDTAKIRRNSTDSGETSSKEELTFKRQLSLDNRSKSSDREESEEKDKFESMERRTERRIRNKDRPSLVIYQPGMGKFSKQRLAKEKDIQPPIGKSVNDSEKKDT